MEEGPMKGSPRTDSPDTHDTEPNAQRSLPPRRSARRPYQKPRVEPAGAVFSRTKALVGGAKDPIIGGSVLL